MSVYPDKGSSRGGVRGGRDAFSWDDVANDRQKGNYLGSSVKLDKTWWTSEEKRSKEGKKKSSSKELRAEKKEIKALEEQLMREALYVCSWAHCLRC
jgi:hypothetical protein